MRKKLFVLHVGSRQSIGPHDLRVLWATACQSIDIDVSRNAMASREHDRPTYGLWADRGQNLHEAESRMRFLLEARGYQFSLSSLPL
jgi:hypothetical protein